MKARMALAAAITIGLSPLAATWAQEMPSAKTKTVLACLLGMARDGCETDFLGFTLGLHNVPLSHFDVRRLITYCSKRYVHRRVDNCYSGPLERVQYLGTNAAGSDVYDVEFMHMDKTYVISPPAPDGRISSLWIIEGPAIQSIRHDVVTVTAPAAQTLYTRPRQYASF